jgi:hypothetical protein
VGFGPPEPIRVSAEKRLWRIPLFLSYDSATPLTLDASLPLDWTNLIVESLQNIFTAG